MLRVFQAPCHSWSDEPPRESRTRLSPTLTGTEARLSLDTVSASARRSWYERRRMSSSVSTALALPPEFADPAFRQRRTVNWLVLGFLYMSFYATRYNFAATMSELSRTFGWTNTELGVFETMMPLVYGLSVVFNGPLADRIGGRKAFLFGAVGVTAMNFAFGAFTLAVVTPAIMAGTGHDAHLVTPAVLSNGFTPRTLLLSMATVWGINGYFQSFGALSIVKVNAQWFHVRERGTFAGVFGVLIRLGLILAFSGVPFILTVLPLRWAFWLPGTFVAVMFVVNYVWMRDSPADAGFGRMDTGEGDVDDGKPASLRFVLHKVFASKTTWLIAACSMMLGMVRRSTVDSWYPKYFKEIHLAGTSGDLAHYWPYQTAVWGIGILGIVGGFAFGIASDRAYGGRRAPVITYGFLGMATTLTLLGLAHRFELGPWPPALCLAVLSFFVNGAHGMIGGAASMDFGGRKAAATAAGLFDGMQYLASSMVGIGMGKVLDNWGWGAWPWVPIPFAIIGAALIARLWNVTPGQGAHAK
jgi:OPA family glycerol-3-phosphate transporter-like MFS transporter